MKNQMWRAVLLLTSLLVAGSAAATEETPAASGDFEPVRVGTTRAALQERFGDALRTVDVAVTRSPLEQITGMKVTEDEKAGEPNPGVGQKRNPFAGQERLGRNVASEGIRSAEYDLFQDRVYRTRWRLDDRFERPLMSSLILHLRERLGEPAYDQTIEARVASGKSDLRRTGWRRGRRAFEVRQLHPFNGGPFFVSLSDLDALDQIVAARGVALPQPDSTGAWWNRPQREVSLASAEERSQLFLSIDALLTKIEFAED